MGRTWSLLLAALLFVRVEVAAGEGEGPTVALHNVHLKVGPGHHLRGLGKCRTLVKIVV